MNAETRAKEIVVEIIGGILADGAITQGSGERWTALINNALRQAENDKLEEAARFFETGGDEAWEVYPKEIARNLRSLKFGTDILLERTFADDAPRSLEKD